MIENFTPTASIVIIGAIALGLIMLYNFTSLGIKLIVKR